MNIPTKITIVRMALIPLMLAFYWLQDVFSFSYLIVLAIFAIASGTDFLDGYLARKWNQVTDLGKFLDPIADKVLVLTGLLIMIDSKILPMYIGTILCTIILAREFIIGVFRQIAATKGVVLQADKWGKAKTLVTMFSMTVMLFSPIKVTFATFGNVIWWIGMVTFVVATLLTIISGVNYVTKNSFVFKGEKKDV